MSDLNKENSKKFLKEISEELKNGDPNKLHELEDAYFQQN